MNKEPTKRQLQANAARERLRQSSLRLFSEKGYENVTIEMICQKAGVSKGLFYNYFPAKEEVLLEEFRNADRYYLKVAERFAPEMSALERTERLFQAIWENIHDSPINLLSARIAFGMAIREGESAMTETVNHERGLYKVFREIFAYGRQKGQVREGVTPEAAQHLFYLCALGLCMQAFVTDGGEDLPQYLVGLDAVFSGVFRRSYEPAVS